MSNPIFNTQVVIIGAGPTGLSLAAQLIRFQIDFIILDKKETTTTFSKALVIQARTLELFEELGIARKAIEEGQITTAMNMFYKGKQRAHINLSGLGEGLSPFPFALSLEQSKTEKLLADFILNNQKTIWWNTEFISVEQQPQGVTVICKTNNEERIIQASYVVGCDGASSALRHLMGLPFEGSTDPKLFYVADIILKSPVICKSELYIYMIRRGFALFFPMQGERHYRIVGTLPDVKDPEKEIKFEDISESIRTQIISPVEFEKLQWFSAYKVHSRKADHFMNKRCFIAGDAAHIHTPAGGQGMNTGIQDAYNLAWKLAGVLRGELKENILETYDTERTGNAKHLLQSTDRMFDLMSGSNSFMNFLRLTIFPYLLSIISKNELVKKQLFPLISQTGISYPDSMLTIPGVFGKVKAGDRIHYFKFTDGRNIFQDLTEPVFKLLFFGKTKTKLSFSSAIKIKIKYLMYEEIPEDVFGNEKNFYLLLRPDNHISYIGKELSAAEDFLKRIEQ
ncbi:MAG TPA: FAD-dependent monooxygenase [Cytophagaceae bacterium]|nr:FAD-dependent monooxygenase [Cytophagaceae bacterium]